MKNQIIINADDFGWDESCSKAILSAFECGYISTSTMCVNGAYFEEAVSLIQNSIVLLELDRRHHIGSRHHIHNVQNVFNIYLAIVKKQETDIY